MPLLMFVIGVAVGTIIMDALWAWKIREIIRTGEYDMLINKVDPKLPK